MNLISDDYGKWAVSDFGMQPVAPEGGFTETVGISSIVDPDDWMPSIREALDEYFAAFDGDSTELDARQPTIHEAESNDPKETA